MTAAADANRDTELATTTRTESSGEVGDRIQGADASVATVTGQKCFALLSLKERTYHGA